MKRLLPIIVLACFSMACAELTPREKYWTAAVATALAVGFVAANSHSEKEQLNKKKIPASPNCSQPGACN